MREKLQKYWRRKKRPILISAVSVAVLTLGFTAGFLVSSAVNNAPDPCLSSFTFINPNLDCGFSDRKTQSLASLETQLNSDIAGYEQNGQATRIGISVRDLASNRFIGINDNSMFYMASLLKVPVLIAGYKLAEIEPSLLDQQITYTGTPNLYAEQEIKPAQVLTVGQSYSVRELIRRAIVYSDNTAAQILFNYYPPGFIDRVIQTLGLEFVRPEGTTENFVTPRSYANMFRLLYNASYLMRDDSNQALSLLTQSAYRDGAVALLPSSVQVAHKFAERTIMDPANPSNVVRQLHECGLVYAKNGDEPYTFCIMTEGTDYGQLQTILQNLSLEIYNAMVGTAGN